MTANRAVAVGVMRVVLSFEIKRLRQTVDEAFQEPAHNGAGSSTTSRPQRLAPTAS
ncbi:MAG TPA: hypothetical protein VGI50_11805 [Solirubrobacteraceae bacterium]